MTRKIAYCIAHYGKPYFAAAVEAMYDQVDRIVVLYASSPSQGFRPDMVNPDTEQDLMTCCNPFWDKVTWVNGTWGNEGEHVDAYKMFSAAFDWAIRLDSDEIYPPGMVDEMIRQAEESNHKDYRIPFVHHWRSFAHGCRDAQMPTRLTRIKGGEGERYLDSQNGKWEVNHMGYAPDEIHRVQARCIGPPSPNSARTGYETRWKANALVDVHPCHLQLVERGAV
jgi:hypothetical protein